jgi:hypothetical protein
MAVLQKLAMSGAVSRASSRHASQPASGGGLEVGGADAITAGACAAGTSRR